MEIQSPGWGVRRILEVSLFSQAFSDCGKGSCNSYFLHVDYSVDGKVQVLMSSLQLIVIYDGDLGSSVLKVG